MDFLEQIFNIDQEKEIIGLTPELKSIYIYNKYKKEKKSIILVTSNLHTASKYYEELINHTDNVWLFPMDDFLTSEAIAISPEFKTTRLETINHCLKIKKGIIITNLMGYLRFLPPKQSFKKSFLKLTINQEYNQQELIKKLYNLGYKKQTTVNMTGEIAIRGFVLDIFPINQSQPIRIEFWGDTIEKIATFNIDDQRTKTNLQSITIYPNTEQLIETKEPIPYRDIYKHTKVTSISEYLDNPTTIYDDYHNLKLVYNQLQEEIMNYNQSKERKADTKYMHNLEEIKVTDQITFETFENQTASSKTKIYNTKEIEPFTSNPIQTNQRLNQYIKTNKKIIIALENRYQINRLIETLENKNTIITNAKEIYQNKINLIIKKINQGFETENYIIITQKELYGKTKTNSYKSKFKYGVKIKDISKLQIGDYVVHGNHGIGRYLGIKTVPKNGIKKDYITIQYKDNDKLYIPVEKIDHISKYSSKDTSTPKLNKLGSHDWEKTKAKAQKRAEDIAKELLELYAIREAKKGYAFKEDTKEQYQFEKEFSHQETIDQLKVIQEIKKDMESPKPMDRLICGDVGYGKTEVAFRAIFKCIMSNKQAALLCPTTILSSQHYQNAIERFKSFPVNIELINRFITPSKTKEIINHLQEGKIDLLIGTHRLLSDDINFKDLGLLVIDEEQRFGVKHKEKIKTYKNNIDVLTLSATPIPRTLQMSMTGIRSLSLIETPPAQRYPIQTYVLAENNQIIKEAIYKEIARKGQVFILFNQIKNLEEKKSQLQKLIPDVTIEIAHGKMNKNELEKVMQDFSNKKFDILLCTTIIETGIDIPTVNTLIIIDADHFGLSQLYQIRGRIGRSNKIAYCYLMYDNKKILTEIATKRLKVIKDFTELGSGFSIAMRDLSIRGAGDILGSQQAGFIDSIGIELFLEMLNEAVQKLKGSPLPKSQEKPNPLIEVETYIPDTYIKEEELKLEIHKKINQINSYKKLKQVKEEIEDRFGKVSEDLIIYMHEEWFEKLAQKLQIEKIRQTKNFIEITLNKEITNKINGEQLFIETTKISRMFRFSMKMEQLIITLDTIKLEKHFIYYLIELLKTIEKNIKKQ